MNLLIVGAGGREHSLAFKASRSPELTNLHITPGNGGMESIGNCWGITDLEAIVAKAKEESIELAIIGQEDYLCNGLTEKLESAGILVCGPSQAAAQLEGSKAFSKDFMARHNIPTAGYGVFTEAAEAKKYLKTLTAPYVIKASGLAAGKGVVIAETLEIAEAGIDEMMVAKVFGASGDQVVIEEFLTGEEASYFVFADGKSYKPMLSLQDHKRQLELDLGPNTGGMGCYAPAPVVTKEVEQRILDEVAIPTLEGMAKDGMPYKGILYIGLMIDNGVPSVVEYNIRFGDPECQPLMMMLKSDLLEVTKACANGTLDQVNVEWHEGACANVVLASGGYPKAYEKGFTIQGLEETPQNEEQMVFHAGTQRNQNRFTTNGGRVLGVTSRGEDLQDAIDKTYKLVEKINWPGMQYRRDIGIKGLKHGMDELKGQKKVGIIMGSASDMNIAQKAVNLLEEFNVEFDLIVASAHRTPERAVQFIKDCEDKGIEVFIAIAGLAAHLPGVVASKTILPVIGVPVDSNIGGLDALYSIVQMPPGIPVASVGIGRGDNAALLALQILGSKYPAIKSTHKEYRLKQAQKVIDSQPEGY